MQNYRKLEVVSGGCLWLPSVGVAQLVERRTVAPNVVGSNPISHPSFFSRRCKIVVTESANLCVWPDHFRALRTLFHLRVRFAIHSHRPYQRHNPSDYCPAEKKVHCKDPAGAPRMSLRRHKTRDKIQQAYNDEGKDFVFHSALPITLC